MKRDFGCGHFRTRSGHRAIVPKLIQKGQSWSLRGAIECPSTGVLHLSEWTIYGSNLQDSDFDLSHEIGDEPIEDRIS